MSCTAVLPALRAPTPSSGALRCLALLLLASASLLAQSPAPGGSAGPVHWLRQGADLLDREDPVGAWRAYREAVLASGGVPDSQVGLGRAHLMLGRSDHANLYAEAAIAAEPQNQDAMALCVRALIRGRAFDEAVQRSSSFLGRIEAPGAELLAARASALFRVQRTEEAAAAYQAVVGIDSASAEAHLRLGSGLLPPTEVRIGEVLRAAVARAQRGDHEAAAAGLRAVLAREPAHPVAHRLLGEVLYAQRYGSSMAARDESFAALARCLPQPDVRHLPIEEFVSGYRTLSAPRRLVVDRAVALFGRHLPKLIAIGGSHDLLRELERTTDAETRSGLRGKRTFDGRVWDDVRGIGGLQAATGIESLDEAVAFGFDTLVHEISHQVHMYSFSRVQKARIKQLYQQALREGRCLDYYAASNDAEYFGQGVEAFACLAKRPGGETTHGHTRFELLRVDPELHEFIADVVEHDPLRDAERRDRLLALSVAVARRCGRPADAVVAASLMRAGAERERLLAEARAELAAERSY